MYSNKTTIAAITFGLCFATASFAQPSYTYAIIPPPADFKITATLTPNPQPPGDPTTPAQPTRIVYGLRWISDDGTRGVGTGVVNGDNGAQLTVCFTYQNGTYTLISTPSVNCQVTSGNNNGDFIGALATPGDTTTHAFVYNSGGFQLFDNLLPQVFPNPDPMVRSWTAAINANGQVLGTTFTTQTTSSPFTGSTGNFLMYSWLYSNGTVSRVADFGGAYNSAFGLNDNGDVVGFASTPGPRFTNYHATLNPSAGGVIDLGTGGGPLSTASFINAKGQIAGTTGVASDDPSHTQNHPFMYENGVMTVMQIPGDTGGPTSLNDAGEVVGSYVSNGKGHLFYYKNGQATDLNSLVANLPEGMILVEARQINNQGQILAIALPVSDLINGEPTTVLLTPAPAPTTGEE